MLIFKANTRNLPENETVKAIEIQDMKGTELGSRLRHGLANIVSVSSKQQT